MKGQLIIRKYGESDSYKKILLSSRKPYIISKNEKVYKNNMYIYIINH